MKRHKSFTNNRYLGITMSICVIGALLVAVLIIIEAEEEHPESLIDATSIFEFSLKTNAPRI